MADRALRTARRLRNPDIITRKVAAGIFKLLQYKIQIFSQPVRNDGPQPTGGQPSLQNQLIVRGSVQLFRIKLQRQCCQNIRHPKVHGLKNRKDAQVGAEGTHR